MRVAVLICVYKNNRLDWFKDAVDSLIFQSYKDINIYLGIDGELSDEMNHYIDIVSVFYKVFRSETNIGLANMLNKLIMELEDEKYVFRMDSDDIALSDRFIDQINFMEVNLDVGICGMSIEEFYDDSSMQIRSYPTTHEALKNAMHKSSPFAHPTVCFRGYILRDVLKSYPTNYYLCEDIAMWFKALELGVRFANIDKVGLKYRVQDSFYNRRSRSKALSEFKIYIKGVKQNFGISIKLIAPILRLLIRLTPYWLNKWIYKSKLRQKFLK